MGRTCHHEQAYSRDGEVSRVKLFHVSDSDGAIADLGGELRLSSGCGSGTTRLRQPRRSSRWFVCGIRCGTDGRSQVWQRPQRRSTSRVYRSVSKTCWNCNAPELLHGLTGAGVVLRSAVMEIHAHVPKMGKTASHWLLEAIFIVTSVGLGFALAGYRESRAEHELARQVLTNVHAEVEQNLAILTSQVAAHRAWLDGIAKPRSRPTITVCL